jgi:3-deoxy-D-manno-octulosonic-acid transferase
MIFFYNLLLYLVYPLLWLVARFHRRLGENFALRAQPVAFNGVAGKRHIWFHASSAGEFEQVRAVALELRKQRKDFFFSFSYFSDSAYRAKKNDNVPDVFFALPFDFSWRMNRLIKCMRPEALIIGKYDAWPNQVRAAHRAGVPVYLISATLPERSQRHKWPLKNLMNGIYAPMRQIFAVNAEHAARLGKISPLNVSVTGDTRFDAIAARLKEATAKKKDVDWIKNLFRGKTLLVAGSSYATSEKMIVDYLAQKKQVQKKPVAAIIAPHHIREEKISALEALCKNAALKVNRLSQREKSIPELSTSSGRDQRKPNDVDVLIIDNLGLLPLLYPLADVAYVGGGFEGSVHSVIEATLAGAPTITGPHIANSPEALELEAAGLLQKMHEPDVLAFAGLVENLCKSKTVLAKKMQIYSGQRLGVSRKIVHTVMDDIFSE